MKAAEIIEGADPRVGDLFEFWNAARGANRYPAQADLKLSAIPRLLPNVFVIDVLEGHVFRYRFIGTRIDEHMGVPLTGKVFSDARSGRLLREITGFFSRIAEQGVLGLLVTRLPSERYEWLRYTRVGLPVADDHRTVNKILGLFLFEPAKEIAHRTPGIGDVDQSEPGEVTRQFGVID